MGSCGDKMDPINLHARGSGLSVSLTAFLAVLALLPLFLAPARAGAQPAPVPPPPYSLPWLLRPAATANVVRLDTTKAFYEDATNGSSGFTLVESLIASRKVSARVAPLLRLSWVRHSAPDASRELSGRAFSNPLAGLSYVRPLLATGGCRSSARPPSPSARAEAGPPTRAPRRLSHGASPPGQRWITRSSR